MQPKQKRILVVSTICVLLLSGYVGVRRLDHSLRGAGAEPVPCPDSPYLWAANSQFVTVKTTPLPAPANAYNQEGATVTVDASRVDVITGQTKPLAGLSKVNMPLKDVDIRSWSVSPDGTSMLYTCGMLYAYEDENARYAVYTLSNDNTQRLDEDYYVGVDYAVDTALWLPDSRILIMAQTDSHDRAALINSDVPGDNTVAEHVQAGRAFALGVTSGNLLVQTNCFQNPPTPAGAIILYVQGIYPSTAPYRQFHPALPTGSSVLEAALSPKRSLISWTVRTTSHSPFYNIIKRIAPAYSAQFAPRPITSIYISGLDGGGMRLVGSEDSPPGSTADELTDVKWRPDGHALAYRWRRRIYTVPVY